MKNVRIISESLREFLEKYEIGYPFDETLEYARRDEDEDCFDEDCFDDDDD